RLVPACKRYLDADMRFELYDEALRGMLITDPPGAFGFEDVTGLPWTEIDFKEDIDHANRVVMEKLLDPRPDRPNLSIVGD
ncbi:MAG: phosphocholine cytidylyltransferase family protein, partial [Alphaproteobacteria bacterium]